MSVQNYVNRIIQIFSGINDVPRDATASLAENGSKHSDVINGMLNDLDTDLNDFESRVTALESAGGGSVTQNFTIDFGSANFASWFPTGASGTPIFALYFLPKGMPFFVYTIDGFLEMKTIDLDLFPEISSSSTFTSQTSTSLLQILESDLDSNNQIDITDYVATNGEGLYIPIFYDFLSSGSGGNSYDLWNGTGISFTKDSGNDAVEPFILQRQSGFNTLNNSKDFTSNFGNSNANNNMSITDRHEGLLVTSEDFDVNYTINALT